MSKYTADEVAEFAKNLAIYYSEEAGELLRELARRIRKEEEEGKRDVVKHPKAGDRVEAPGSHPFVYGRNSIQVIFPEDWEAHCRTRGAKIIPRREVAR